MMIHRINHKSEGNFVCVTNRAAQDTRLSFEARGLLLYLLSHADGWIVQLTDIMRQGNCGEKRAKRILKELIDVGYIKQTPTRNQRGQFAYNYDVYESEQLNQQPTTVTPLRGCGDGAAVTAPLHNTETNTQNIKQKHNKHPYTPPALKQPPPQPKPMDGDGSNSEKKDQEQLEREGLLKSAGVRGKPIDDFATRFTARQITNVITYAQEHNLGPGWIVNEIAFGNKGIRDKQPEPEQPDDPVERAYQALERQHEQWVAKLRKSPYAAIYAQNLRESEHDPIEPESDPATEPQFLTGTGAA